MPVSALPQAMRVRRLRRGLVGRPLPVHVGLIMDGNRRWARRAGLASPSLGHRHGARHVADALAWCEAVGIGHLTAFVCSTENLQRRDQHEIAHLMHVIEEVVAEGLLESERGWRVHVAGDLDLLPRRTAAALERL